VLALTLQHHPHRTLAGLGREGWGMLGHGSILARSGASENSGAVKPAIADSKEGLPRGTPIHCVTKHLQQGIESDHFRAKRRIPRVGGFR
jgi:hypothetical protein